MVLHVDCSSSRVRKGTRCCTWLLEHARTNSGGGALATGQLEYLSCVWQNLSFLDHPRLQSTLPPSHNVRTVCLSLDARRVRVRMFGYAKCSRASQVECLMAHFCLNTDLDTTAEQRICIHSPTCSPAAPRASHIELHQRTPFPVLREMRFGFLPTGPVRVKFTTFCVITSCESSGSF